MKKAIVLIALVAIVMMGCASVNRPLLLGDGTVGPKTGQASGTIYLPLYGGIGDADVGMITAAKNAGITKIGAVDFRVKNLFGFVSTYTTTVTGQ